MITSLYAVLFASLILWLSLKVIGFRRQFKVSLGDGGYVELQQAIAAHHNAIEYLPIALVLMLLLELSGASPWWLHLTGLALLAGRLLHAKAMLTSNLKIRVRGMQITIWTIMGLITLNMVYLPFSALF